MNLSAMICSTVSGAWIDFPYDDTVDLWSLRLALVRLISPSLATGTDFPAPGEAFVYVEPIEGYFRRPAITLQLIAGSPQTPWPARSTTSYRIQEIALRVYDETRQGTLALSEAVMSALGSKGGDGLRVPMWSFWTAPGLSTPQVAMRLGRMLRIERSSLSMSLEEPDDDRQWSRTITLRCYSPRRIPAPVAARVRGIFQVAYPGWLGERTVFCTMTAGSPTIWCPGIGPGDQGSSPSGPGIPPGSIIGEVQTGISFTLMLGGIQVVAQGTYVGIAVKLSTS